MQRCCMHLVAHVEHGASQTDWFRPLEIGLALWATFGLAVGSFFVTWPHLASLGVLY